MEQGWAIVIGAAIALVGATVTPWVKESIERRNRIRDSRREALRAALAMLVQNLTELLVLRGGLNHQERRSAASVAITNVALLLDPRDAGIEEIAMTAFNYASGLPTNEAGMVLSAFQSTVHQWFRYEVHGAQIKTEFERWLLKAQADHDRMAAQQRS